jgi:hypothetical protein
MLLKQARANKLSYAGFACREEDALERLREHVRKEGVAFIPSASALFRARLRRAGSRRQPHRHRIYTDKPVTLARHDTLRSSAAFRYRIFARSSSLSGVFLIQSVPDLLDT